MSLLTSISSKYRRRSRELRSAVVRCFVQPAACVSESLSRFTEVEWHANLAWLDTSGLAIYLLDRVLQLHCEQSLPPSIFDRLIRNLADNTAKNDALLAETVALNQGLEEAGVLFSNLKGISLTPLSVPEHSLRLQLDLDFLIDQSHAERAARVFEAMGYARVCISGETWEFKAGGTEIPSMENLYQAKSQRVAEVHLAPAEGLLDRIALRTFGSVTMPVLSPVDLYLQQAVHLFKHLNSSFTRAAWVLEYRRHMLARCEEVEFWRDLENLVSGDLKSRVALGAASLLVAEVFGDQPTPFLSALIESSLSGPVRLWIRRYGRAAMLADFPGTKLYLLLQAELNSARPQRKALLPLAPPPMITLRHRGENLQSKLKRARLQCNFIVFRMRFHGVEGFRYLLESFRFRRLIAGLIP